MLLSLRLTSSLSRFHLFWTCFILSLSCSDREWPLEIIS